MVEFASALDARLKSAVASNVRVGEALAFVAGSAGVVAYRVEYQPSGAHPLALLVVVDIDIFTRGPATEAAENIADAVERSLIDWSVVTTRQGCVRLSEHSRATLDAENEKLAHVTLRVTGRCFRRL